MSTPSSQILAALQDLTADQAIAESEDLANEESATSETSNAYDQLQPMEQSEVQGVVKQMIQNATGGGDHDNHGTQGNLTLALNYYFGRPRGDEVEGLSEQQSLDVADMVESVLAQTTPLFSNDTVVNFGALNEQDEDQAQEESRMVNHVIMQQNRGYVLLYLVTKDALLQKNGVVEVLVDEKFDVQVEEYEDLDPLNYLQKLQPRSQDEQVSIVNEQFNGGRVSLELKRIIKQRKLIIDAVAPEDFLYYAAQEDVDLSDCPFTARRVVVMRSELLQHGFDPDIVARLPKYTSKDDQVSVSRNQTANNDASRYTSAHFSTDPIEIYRCYARIDEDGDGIAELRKITVAGRSSCEILEDIPWTHVPFAAGTAYLQPHRFRGMSLFDKLWDVQDGKTRVLRQWDDNRDAVNNSTLGVDYKGVEDMDTIVNRRSGGVMLFNRPPREAAQEITTSDMGGACIQALDYFDRIASRRAGASLDIQSRAASIPGGVGSQGLDRLMTAEERIADMMARNFGETLLRNLYMLVHRTLRMNYQSQLTAKIGSRWVESDPSKWPARDDIEVLVGLTGPERLRKMNTLSTILDQQVMVLGNGGDGVLVNYSKIHNTLTDYAEMGNISHPDRYWIDPDSDPAMERQQQNQQQALQQNQQQAQAVAAQAQMQTQVAQAELGKARAQMMQVQLRARVEEMKQQLEQLQAASDESLDNRKLALEYAKLVDQHQKWLTELEVQANTELNRQAQQNRPGNAP